MFEPDPHETDIGKRKSSIQFDARLFIYGASPLFDDDKIAIFTIKSITL
jgi:hypothetical protein